MSRNNRTLAGGQTQPAHPTSLKSGSNELPTAEPNRSRRRIPSPRHRASISARFYSIISCMATSEGDCAGSASRRRASADQDLHGICQQTGAKRAQRVWTAESGCPVARHHVVGTDQMPTITGHPVHRRVATVIERARDHDGKQEQHAERVRRRGQRQRSEGAHDADLGGDPRALATERVQAGAVLA